MHRAQKRISDHELRYVIFESRDTNVDTLTTAFKGPDKATTTKTLLGASNHIHEALADFGSLFSPNGR